MDWKMEKKIFHHNFLQRKVLYYKAKAAAIRMKLDRITVLQMLAENEEEAVSYQISKGLKNGL